MHQLVLDIYTKDYHSASLNRNNNPNDSQDMSGIYIRWWSIWNDEKERAIWQTYDDFAVKDHTRILHRYLNEQKKYLYG